MVAEPSGTNPAALLLNSKLVTAGIPVSSLHRMPSSLCFFRSGWGQQEQILLLGLMQNKGST